MGNFFRSRPLMLVLALSAHHAAASQEPTPAPLSQTAVETIVFVRHGEKQSPDAGQLSCQGLNRALALPDLLAAKFGRPDFVFAPLTSKRTTREGTFSYVRALATIEPTAIRAGLPVETRFAYDDIAGLQGELLDKPYQRATVFVAWEHRKLEELVRRMVSAFGGNEKDVPDWPTEDFDSIFVLRLRTEPEGRKNITFEHDHEGLDGLSRDCPTAKGK